MLRWLYIRLIAVIGALMVAVPTFAATGFLDTPDSCLSVQEVQGTTIYLQRVGNCVGKPGRIFVEAALGEERDLVLDGRSLGRQAVQSIKSVDVTTMVERADKLVGNKEIPLENSYDSAMQEMAAETKFVYDSQEFQNKIFSEAERIKSVTLGDQLPSYYKNTPEQPDSWKLGHDERVYIFVSSSIPVPVLKTYVADAAKLRNKNIHIVLRGFVQGMSKIGPTIKFMSDVLKKDSSCDLRTAECQMHSVSFIVDPMLFRKHGINQVPAFVYVKGIKVSNPEMSEGDVANLKQNGESFAVYGDASLGYILSKLATTAQSPALERLSAALR